jgi:hypothetical protein|tara:strand:+ start:728 stop:1753 length:1026 start_codon:yes stop_codon:yes gene_type:complete
VSNYDYKNPLYAQPSNTSEKQARIAWLEDRITQMGHPPKQYELWHQELEVLKRQPKHAKQEPVVRLDKFVGRHAAVLKDQASLRSCTDHELKLLKQFVNDEISRRETARHKIKMQRIEKILQSFKDKGWLPEQEALVEVRRVIVEKKILGMGKKRAARELSDKIMRAMWRGDKPWGKGPRSVGQMPSGYFGYEPGKNSKTHYYLDPKQLLCHVIRQWKYRLEEEERAIKEAAERKRFHDAKLKEWEEKQRQRSRQVAQEWHARMTEANGRWKEEIAKLEARKVKGQPCGRCLPKEEVTDDVRHAVAWDTLKWVKKLEEEGKLEYAIKSGTPPTKDLPEQAE